MASQYSIVSLCSMHFSVSFFHRPLRDRNENPSNLWRKTTYHGERYFNFIIVRVENDVPQCFLLNLTFLKKLKILKITCVTIKYTMLNPKIKNTTSLLCNTFTPFVRSYEAVKS